VIPTGYCGVLFSRLLHLKKLVDGLYKLVLIFTTELVESYVLKCIANWTPRLSLSNFGALLLAFSRPPGQLISGCKKRLNGTNWHANNIDKKSSRYTNDTTDILCNAITSLTFLGTMRLEQLS